METLSALTRLAARFNAATAALGILFLPANRRLITDGAIAGRSERTLRYQEQITGLPRGLEVRLNGVRFDGCRETDGTMLEAKGPGYAAFMDCSGSWKDWFTGSLETLKEQMKRQSKSAASRLVEWHFAEKPVAGYFRNFAMQEELPNIIVFYTPPEAR